MALVPVVCCLLLTEQFAVVDVRFSADVMSHFDRSRLRLKMQNKINTQQSNKSHLDSIVVELPDDSVAIATVSIDVIRRYTC